jgi:TolB-like protein/tetratricopeptide (TPR) repeat protein
MPLLVPLASPATVTAAPVPSPSSLAVLPFTNLSGDTGHAYFADGLTDEIRDALMRVPGLRVTARSSSVPAMTMGADLVDLGRRLSVGAVLSGSVRREAARVRVIAQLTDISTGLIVWSEAFDRDSREWVDVQTTIATAVAGALRVRVNPGSDQLFSRRSNDDPVAHDLVLRGRALASTRTTEALAASIDLFAQAIARDAGYALAFAGLADAHGTLAFNGAVAPADAVSRARAAATEALRLDPSLGEALAHLASLDAFVDWNWAHSDPLFERAIALTPSHARARAWHGQSLAARGRFAEAIAALVAAQQLDPLSSSVTYALGETYLYAARPDDAIAQARRLLAANPRSWGGHNLLARALFESRRWTEARDALAFSRGELWADVTDLVAAGLPVKAREELHRRASTLESTEPYTLAALASVSGDRTAAIRWLQAALEMRQVGLASLAVDPSFRTLQGDGEYEAIVRRIGVR